MLFKVRIAGGLRVEWVANVLANIWAFSHEGVIMEPSLAVSGENEPKTSNNKCEVVGMSYVKVLFKCMVSVENIRLSLGYDVIVTRWARSTIEHL